MLTKAIDRVLPNYSQLKDRSVFVSLLVLSFFLRFPFVFRDYIDRDESTFILVAQSWVDGYLPYTELWDLKPPGTFLFFSVIIFIFGKSLVAIRLAGIIVVAVIALYTYKIGCQVTERKISFWAAILTVFLVSMFGSLQGVMSEHLSVFFMMPGIYLLVKYRTWRALFIAGLLMGAALMTKINLAYPVLLLGIFLIALGFFKPHESPGIRALIALVLGGLLSIGLTVLPYSIEGQTALWWNSVVLAPLKYSGVGRDSLGRFAPLLIFVVLLFAYGIRKKVIDIKDFQTQIIIIAIAGVILAFLRGGRINGHYLIQLHPLLILFAAMVFASFKIWNWNYVPLAFLVLLAMPAEAYKEYFAIIEHKRNRGTFQNGEGYTVPEYIRRNRLPVENILFLEYHIGYWFLDTTPPTKAATHPTNLCRDEIFTFFNNPRKTSIEELRYIMEDVEPAIVVTRKRWRIFDKKEIDENTYLRAYLDRHYEIIQLEDGAEIHRRLE